MVIIIVYRLESKDPLSSADRVSYCHGWYRSNTSVIDIYRDGLRLALAGALFLTAAKTSYIDSRDVTRSGTRSLDRATELQGRCVQTTDMLDSEKGNNNHNHNHTSHTHRIPGANDVDSQPTSRNFFSPS